MSTAELVALCVSRGQLPFLVIGGHAVIAHGFARNTMDLDLLVRRADRAAWIGWLAEIGYRPFHEADSFIQFTPPADSIPLDLMLVNETTFQGLSGAAREEAFGDVQVRIPSLEHLLALKLHALKQGLRHRVLGDLDDVINLVLINRINLGTEDWRAFFAKYGNLELYEQVWRATRPG